MCRGRHPGLSAVVAFDDPAQTLGRAFSAAYLQHRSHDGADHVTQETVGRDGKDQAVRLGGIPMRFFHAAEESLHVCFYLGEPLDILVLPQDPAGTVHGREVQRSAVRIVATGQSVEGVFSGVEEVLVLAAGGVETGVCLILDLKDAPDGNVRRKNAIQTAAEVVRAGDRLRAVEVGEHLLGVYAGVGTSGGGESRRLPQEFPQSILEDRLDAQALVFGLALAAPKRSAQVGKLEKVPHRPPCSFIRS